MRVSVKSILKAAEQGNLEYLNNVVNNSGCVKKSFEWMKTKDKKGRTPLHLACMNGHVYILRLIWKVIIEYTKDGSTRIEYLDITDHKGRTSLFHAAAKGHLIICNYLIDRQANLDIGTNENHESPGSTALMACAEKNRVECFKLLSRKGGDIITMREDGADAIYMAARYGNHEIIRHIAEHNLFQLIINRKSFHGRTALVTAALHGHIDACKELHTNGFDLDHQDDDMFTALIYATNEGHFMVVKWLVKNGANVYIKDKYGATAWELAIANDFSEMAGFLEEWQANLERGKNVNQLMKMSINRALSRVKITGTANKMGKLR